MRYQYTGDLSAVTEFQHGQDGVTLTRAVPKLSLVVPTVNDTDEPLPDEFEPAVEFGTIVIEPGDILELGDIEIVHAHFELLDPVPEAEPETERQRKAREKAEAKAAKPADASPATAPQDSSSTPAHPVTGSILTPETGAQRSAPIDEPGNPAELGNALDAIATEHIPDGMTDTFRSAGIIPN